MNFIKIRVEIVASVRSRDRIRRVEDSLRQLVTFAAQVRDGSASLPEPDEDFPVAADDPGLAGRLLDLAQRINLDRSPSGERPGE